MKLNNSYFYTIREDKSDQDSISGNLLTRAGYIRKTSAGIYMNLPLGLRVLKKIESLVRKEIDMAGAQEVLMPTLINEEVYIESKRRELFGSDMFSVNDKFNKKYVLGPTHEELFVLASKFNVKSYRDLPFTLYQIQTKYRDETRPRYGLIRVREFIMKDAYSFDKDLEGLDISYNKMFKAYENIFDKLNINYRIVTADTGVMGGLLSEEFQAITDIGEDTLVLCNECKYATNIEVASVVTIKPTTKESLNQKEKIYTGDKKTIKDLSEHLNLDNKKFVKSLCYMIDEKPYVVLINGNREVNETKLLKLMNGQTIHLMNANDLERNNLIKGFIGPIGINVPIIMDNEILSMSNFVTGANEIDYHIKNVNCNDFNAHFVGDVVNIKETDLCPKCNSSISFKKGIEIGNTFKLGNKYSNLLNLKYTDSNNNLIPVEMGCYGIGIGRIMATIVEQNNDDKGIIWPINIAPYKVYIIISKMNDSALVEYANKLYENLNNIGIETILDDRDERIGVKFNDADLIGIPIRITVGNKFNEGLLELKLRKETECRDIKAEEIINLLKELCN